MSGKRDRTPTSDGWGEPLALPGTSQRRRVGPVERGLDTSIRVARKSGTLSDVDAGAVSLARSLARTVDWCHTNTEPHTQTLAAARLSELLTKLRLEPSARTTPEGGTDGWDQWLSTLNTPAEGQGATPAGDTPQP